MKLSSKRHRLKPFEVSSHDCKQSLTANLRTVIAYNRLFSHPMKLNSEKQKRRPLRQTSTRLVPSPLRCLSPVIRFKTLFLVSCLVELAIAEMACVSSNVRRTFHVPSGVRVQRSISERDVSHPIY